MEHLSRRAQVLRVAIDCGDQAGVDAGKLALECSLVDVVLILGSPGLIRLQGLDLLGTRLALWEYVIFRPLCLSVRNGLAVRGTILLGGHCECQIRG